MPDPIIAAAADKLGAIVVTWNHRDFKKLIARVPQAGQPVLRRAGRINFRCSEAQGRYRVEQVIESIEFEYEQAEKRSDKRLMIEVLLNRFSVPLSRIAYSRIAVRSRRSSALFRLRRRAAVTTATRRTRGTSARR